MNGPRIKAVFFDLDNTLHDEGAPGFFAAVLATGEHLANQGGPEAEVLKKAFLSINREMYLSAASPQDERSVKQFDIVTAIWKRSLAACGYTGVFDPTAVAHVFVQERIKRLQRYPETLDVLKKLADEYQLGLITNGQSDWQRTKIEALGLTAYFRPVVISGEIGSGKPSVEIFSEAARLAGVSLHQAVHVGDSLAADVAGAKAAGMTAVWLNRDGRTRQPDEPQSDHEVASLTEVAALLG